MTELSGSTFEPKLVSLPVRAAFHCSYCDSSRRIPHSRVCQYVRKPPVNGLLPGIGKVLVACGMNPKTWRYVGVEHPIVKTMLAIFWFVKVGLSHEVALGQAAKADIMSRTYRTVSWLAVQNHNYLVNPRD